MKSRIPADERALYFHAAPDDGEFSAIRSALEKAGIPVRRLTAACLGSELGALAAPGAVLPEESGETPEVGVRDALIFVSLSRARLDEALRALSQAGAGQGMLKAVLTEHNRRWRLHSLIGELEKEDTLMSAYQQLRTLVLQAIPVLEQSPQEPLAAALERAQAALESQNPSLPALLEARRELEALMDKN